MLGYESFEIARDLICSRKLGLSAGTILQGHVMWAVQMRKKALRQYCLWESTRYNFDMGYLVEDILYNL
jgi:hypothetical protein